MDVLHIAQDANFCLNNRAHQHGHFDKALQPGSAYMADQTPLKQYVKKFANQKEVSNICIVLHLD
jgi:hypothetical protein